MAVAYLVNRLGILVGLVCQSGRSKSLPVSDPSKVPKSNCSGNKPINSTKSPCQLKLVLGFTLLFIIFSQISAFRWPTGSRPVAPNLRQRWVTLTGSRVPNQNNNPSGLIAQIQRRIGARNSIRVHNAFRDLAWRILSRLNMPTPIIYELRRQHLYTPEEDARNDSLSDKNTSKTIRTSRRHRRRSINDDDDDDEQEVGDRLRARTKAAVETLISLSRRTPFGSVIRLPSLLPFKRQERQLDTSQEARTRNPLRRFRRNRRRQIQDSDRQMIFINGKQYYINDDGQLVELPKPNKV